MLLTDYPKHPPHSLMGFDFGTKKIGVAIGQATTASASPLTPIRSKHGKPDWSLLTLLIDEWQPSAFVVGLPYHMDGTSGDMFYRARKFAHRLQHYFKRPSYGMDERLSSRTALRNQNRSGDSIDCLAAAIIIEDWYRAQTFAQQSN